ncbi:hypothetical protein KY325_01500 [Candidatus Woesearchaeota archaeon]|nr:hypothetical protein [Candidatus Woesearchaeota archaeon]MBW3017813.1 hypothetical protein [Candidatus Woesearchaeota archaeon]
MKQDFEDGIERLLEDAEKTETEPRKEQDAENIKSKLFSRENMYDIYFALRMDLKRLLTKEFPIAAGVATFIAATPIIYHCTNYESLLCSMVISAALGYASAIAFLK